MKHLYLACILLFLASFSTVLKAQNDTLEIPALTLSVFADVFYAYDFEEPQCYARQAFFYNHNRHNEFNLNLGLYQFQ